MKFEGGYPKYEKFKVNIRTLSGMPKIWYVSGPRVLRGGRVDYSTYAYYGTINKKTGEIHAWGGRGEAGRIYKIYLEVVRDRLKKRFEIASRESRPAIVRAAHTRLR